MLVVDVEASGTEPYKHSMVSVGALELERPTRRFYGECRIWDGAHVMDEALKVIGLTKEQITDASRQNESELVRSFIEFALEADDRTLAGQNPSFDRDMLRHAAERAGHTDWPFAFRTVDTHTLCYMHMVKRGVMVPHERHRSALDLDAVLVYCGIPREPEPHNAMTGALSHAEVISRLLHDKKLLPEFERYEIPWL